MSRTLSTIDRRIKLRSVGNPKPVQHGTVYRGTTFARKRTPKVSAMSQLMFVAGLLGGAIAIVVVGLLWSPDTWKAWGII